MTTAKVTSKGQITVPKTVRDDLGLRPGDEVDFVKEDGAYRLTKRPGESPFDRWVGYLKDKDFPWKTTDEFMADIRGRDNGD